MNIEIGAFEAKTRLPELLRGVAQGMRFTITNRGRPVAQLVPVEVERDMTPEEARLEFIRIVGEIRSTMKTFATQDGIRAMRDEGRM